MFKSKENAGITCENRIAISLYSFICILDLTKNIEMFS